MSPHLHRKACQRAHHSHPCSAHEEADDVARQLNPVLDLRLRQLIRAQDDTARLEDLTAQEIPVRDGGVRREGAPST